MGRSLKALCLGTVCAVAIATAALGQAKQIDIPAGDLKSALDKYIQQSGVQLIYSADDIRGARTTGAHGTLAPEDALKDLLRGTTLVVHRDASGAIVVAREDRSKNFQAASNEGAAGENAVSPAAIETVVVTGTNIRGVANPTSPINVIDRDAINRTGYTETQQLIASLPQNFGGGSLGATEDGMLGGGRDTSENLSAATGVNLRGLGTDATLVLLNGNRIAPSAIGQTVDVALIPLAAIDRVEILTDGTSAIYGSDAVGGVVNFVLRKDYDGAQSSVNFGTVTGGSLTETTVDQTFGTAWHGGGILLSGQFQNRGSLSTADRSFTATAPQPTNILPAYDQYSGLLSAHQDVLSNLDVSIDALVSRKSTTNAFTIPTRSFATSDDHDQFDVTAGVGYEPFGDWRIDASGTYSRSHDVFTYTRNSDPVGITVGTPNQVNTDQVAAGNIKANGTLFAIPGGNVKAAIGGSYSTEDLVLIDEFPPAQAFPFHRQIASAFAELYVPLVGDDNRLPFVQKLILSAAARYDHYSAIGGTTNPKVGLLWEPVDSLNLRASYGTSFRVPNAADEILASPGNGFIFNFNFTAPNGAGQVPIFLLAGADPNIGPEKAKTWNLGFDYQPKFLGDAKISLDYYNIHFVDRIATPPFDINALEHPNIYGSIITSFASDAAAAAFLATAVANGNTNFGASPTGVRFAYNLQTRNESAVFQSGFDISLAYPFAFGANAFNADVNAAIINQISTTLATGATSTDIVNTYSNPLRLRMRGDLTWTRQDWQVTAAVNYANSYRDTSANPVGIIGASTTLDLTVRYRPTTDFTWMQGLSFNAGVLNLFDQSPPFVSGISQIPGIHYDVGNGNPLGRFVSIGVTKTW